MGDLVNVTQGQSKILQSTLKQVFFEQYFSFVYSIQYNLNSDSHFDSLCLNRMMCYTLLKLVQRKYMCFLSVMSALYFVHNNCNY